MIDRFTLFFSYPTSTTTKYVTQNDGVDFPAITLCNLNPVKRTFVDKHHLSMIMDLVFHPSKVEFLMDRARNFLATCNDFLSQLDDETRSLEFSQIIYDQENAKDFIVQCSFGSDVNSIEYYNCTDQFMQEPTSLGLCYTFNSHLMEGTLKRKVKRPGERYGLRVILNINQDDYSTSLNGNAGVKVSINKHGNIPDLDEKGIFVPPGRNAYVGLRMTRNIDKTMGRKCEKKNPKFEYYHSVNYSVGVCNANAFAADIDRMCNCLHYRTTFNPNRSRNCSVSDTCCISNTSLTRDTRCSEACDTTVYTAQASYAQFPSVSFADELSEILNKSKTNIFRDIMAVNVYFDDVGVIEIETTNPYKSADFLSDLGGVLGLFLGASVISLLELGMLVFDEIKDRTWKKSWKRKMSVIEQNVFDGHIPEVTGEKEDEIVDQNNLSPDDNSSSWV